MYIRQTSNETEMSFDVILGCHVAGKNSTRIWLQTMWPTSRLDRWMLPPKLVQCTRPQTVIGTILEKYYYDISNCGD